MLHSTQMAALRGLHKASQRETMERSLTNERNCSVAG